MNAKPKIKKKLVQPVMWRIPVDVFAEVKKRAEYNCCSVNSMAIQLLLRALEKEMGK